MYIFILNVNAGKNNSYEIGKIVEEYCKLKNVKYSINYVYNNEDTVRIINKYKNFDGAVIYSVGGDGTLNQVINGMANTNLLLNILPTGTGNDFYKSLMLHNDSSIDLGKVNDRYFINVASFGIDAEIANTANILKNKNIKGNLVYSLGIIKNFFTYKAKDISIDKQDHEITILTICNGRYYGGGYMISPYSCLNDGLFDIYEVDKVSKIDMLKLILKLTKGKHVNEDKVISYQTKGLDISSPIELNCNVDGEIIKDKDFSFSMCESAIKLDDDKLGIKELLKHKRIIK